MLHSINPLYALLLESISKLENLQAERDDFEIFYRNQSFLKRKFNLELNRKKTFYTFAPTEQRDRILAYKQQLYVMIRQYFFYENADEEVQQVSKENQEILHQATYSVKKLYTSQFMPFMINRHDRLEGALTEKGCIHLYGTRHKSENLRELTGYGNFYIDFVGVIFPNGEAEFKGNNLSGSTYVSGDIRRWNQYPGLFEMSLNGSEWRISANMKREGELPYGLKGFVIELLNCNRVQFCQNAAWLEKKYGEFKMKFAAVYQ
jgi:hypothetical protein